MKLTLKSWPLLLGAGLLLAACGADSSSDTGSAVVNEDDDTLVVGLEAAYAPYNWTQLDDSNGAVPIADSKEYAGGYDVQIAKIIADELGLELVIVKTEWDGLVPALQSNKIDAIIAGMSPTEDRKQTIDFSIPYLDSQLVMVVESDSEFVNATKLADFSGAKVTAQLNTFHYSVIDQIEGVEKQTAMENFSAMRVALQSGVIDGYVSEKPEAISASNANPDFTYIEFTEGFETNPEDTMIAIGLRKGEPKIEAINQVLEGISSEEQQELMEEAILNQPAAQ
nr:transporter substrate-binding domain-containing protein [Jeotgalibaca dankookensis]